MRVYARRTETSYKEEKKGPGIAMENLSISEPPHQGGGGVATAPAQLPPQMFTTAAQLLDLTDSMGSFFLE